jgi:hypothetical protein
MMHPTPGPGIHREQGATGEGQQHQHQGLLQEEQQSRGRGEVTAVRACQLQLSTVGSY